MSNTFHQSNDSDQKIYLMHHDTIKNHTIWRLEKFWEKSLDSAVKNQISCQPCVKWDDLDQNNLSDLVLSTHNLIFGQLVTLAFTMHELGLEFEEVMYRVRELSRTFQLSEDQTFQLYQSIKSTFCVSG